MQRATGYASAAVGYAFNAWAQTHHNMAALAEVRVDALHKEVWHGWICITRETFRQVTGCTFLLAASAAVVYRLVLVATTEPGSESGTHERSPRLGQPHCVVDCGACAHHALSIALPRLQAIHAIARAATSPPRSRRVERSHYFVRGRVARDEGQQEEPHARTHAYRVELSNRATALACGPSTLCKSSTWCNPATQCKCNPSTLQPLQQQLQIGC